MNAVNQQIEASEEMASTDEDTTELMYKVGTPLNLTKICLFD